MTVGLGQLTRLNEIIGESLGITNGNLLKEINLSSKKILRREARVLRVTAPKRTGAYQSGWTTRKVGNRWVLYNKDRYQLTHLLEEPHKKRGDNGDTNPIIHIAPVEQRAIEEYISEVERILRG